MGLAIGVLGLGAWGQTLADLVERQGHYVRSWSRRSGGSPLEVIQGADLVLVAVALQGVKHLAPELGPHWPQQVPLVSCSKGLDLETQSTASQLWLGSQRDLQVVVLSGPNLADELAKGCPAASVLAGRDPVLVQELQQTLSSQQLRLYASADPLGVELAGALKNVMAIAGGICDGLQLGANAKASLLCRGMAEMALVLERLGGDPASLYGLAGLGDLLATANSPLSRNYRFGLALAEGKGGDEALVQVGATVEGQKTAEAVVAVGERYGLALPICQQVVDLVEGRCGPREAVHALMQRSLRGEQG